MKEIKRSRSAMIEELAEAAKVIKKAIEGLQRMELIPMSYIISKIPGETLVEKCERLGVTRQTMHYWETETLRPSFTQAKLIAKLTGLPIEDIMSQKEKDRVYK